MSPDIRTTLRAPSETGSMPVVPGSPAALGGSPSTPAPRTQRRRRRSERAQSIVEFALILPIFLLIVMATVDFGWALRAWISTTNAAREGARLGVTGANEAAIVSRTVNHADDLIDPDDVVVEGAQGDTGDNVTVTVNIEYTYISPVGGFLSFVTGGALPSPLPITTSTTMRIE
jgi:Flp pilus assembly protein TadG